MSDINIPGINSKYGSDKLIENLMKVERIPRDTTARRLADLQDQKSAWQDINQRMTKLRETATALYSFKNPFNDHVAKSSNEDALTATTTREAIEETKNISVVRVATADRFLSRDLPKDSKVAAGEYDFTVGNEKANFRFQGGTIKEFADAVTRNGRGLVRGSVVSLTGKGQSLLVESLKTGTANRLGFSADAQTLALSTGMVERVDDRERKFPVSDASVQGIGGPRDRNLTSTADGVLLLQPASEASVPFSPPASSSGDMTLEFSLRVTKLPDTQSQPPAPPPGPAIPSTGSISLEGVSVENDPSQAILPEWKPPETPPRVDDPRILSLSIGGKEVPLPDSADSGDFTKLSLRLADYGGDASALLLRNRNTGRTVELKDLRVYDPKASGGFRALTPVSTADDAKISMDGIEVTRGDNQIKDMIPGVTLELHSPSDKPVKLTIEPDRKAIKDALIAFVGNYNQLLAWVNILTTRSETTTAVAVNDNNATSTANDQIIQELDYFTDDEKKTAQKRLGMMQGDFTLTSLKSSLQGIMMNAYPTDSGGQLSMLSQIGISTDTRRGSTGVDQSRLRGYLEADETALDNALKTNIAPIKQLFGNDTNGDLIVDNGVAYQVDTYLKPYVQIGGILALKGSTIDSQLKTGKERLDTYDKQLASKEADLKQKYGAMEGSLMQMQQTSQSIDNFNARGGQ
jgi:flagellar hook-associated protein 2